jgi:transcriptional regulator with XRE-family HTH domain
MARQCLSVQMPITSRAQRLRFEAVAVEFLERMGQRIRARRKELGLSRPDVARAMPGKVSENQIYRWELGKHQPNPDTLEALARARQTDVASLMSPPPMDAETPDLAAPSESQLDVIEDKLDWLIDLLERLVGADALADAQQARHRDREPPAVTRRRRPS